MQVKILRNTVGGGERLKVGDTPELPDRDARFLIALGKAEPLEVKAKKAPKKKAPVNKSIEVGELETKE